MMLVVVLMLCVLFVGISVFKKTVMKKKEVSKGPEASACAPAPGIVGNLRKRPTMMLQQAAEFQRTMMMALLQRRIQMEVQQMEAQQNAEVQMMMMMSQQQGGPQMMSQQNAEVQMMMMMSQ